MTRIEIPIPEPETRQPKFKFVTDDSGTVAVEAETTEDHIAAFRNVTEELDDHYWAQAAVAASLSKKYGTGEYGKGEMDKLADAVELSANYLFKMARTYRTFTESFPRERKLYFKHHVIAAYHTNPSEALALAVEQGMSCSTLEQWVSDHHVERGKKATRKAKQAVKTAFLEHLEHVESIIESDFIKNCPSKDFAHRVYNEWLSEIKFELRQFNRQVNEDLVRAAMEDAGAATLVEIRTTTELPMSDVEAVVGSMVAKGEYEWIPKRGEGEVTRGTHSMMLHKVGTNDGGAFIGARPESRYSN